MERPQDVSNEVPNARARLLALACVVLATFAVFWPVLGNELVYDDLAIVTRNPRIASFAHVPEQFSSATWDFLEPAERDRVGYWRPLTDFALTCANVFGGGSVRAFHLASVLLHLAAVAAAFALAWRLTKHTLAAAFAALLFGLHPIQVESVAWISAINGPLFGALSLASLERFLAWRERGSRGVPWASAVLLALALLAKELAIAVVPCALVLDLFRARADGSWRERLAPLARAYVPLALAFLVYVGARMSVFGSGAGFTLTTTDFGVSAERLALLRAELLGGFLALLAWPARLNLFHPFVPNLGAFDAGMLGPWLAIGALVLALVFARKRRLAVLATALLFVVAALSPVLVRVGSLGIFPLAERFAYLATFGFALALAWALVRALPAAVAVVVLALVAGVYARRDVVRAAEWRDEPTLFAAATAASPRSPYVWWGYGRVLLQRYRADAHDPTRGDMDRLVAAKDAFERALELANAAQKGDASIFAVVDDFVQANIGLGWYYLYEAELDPYHDFETPLNIFKSVVERYPRDENAHTAYGVALIKMGRATEAEAAFRAALDLNPRYAESWHNLGVLRMQRASWNEAADAFTHALELRPGHLEDVVWLARARAQGGDAAGAERLLEDARARHPEASSPLVLLATLRAQRGDFDAALELVRRALDLDPNDGEGLLLKGKLHARAGEKSAAKRAVLRAAELLPQSFEAHYNAASLLLDDKESGVAQAVPFLVRAYALRPPGPAGDALRTMLRELQLADVGTLWELASSDATRGDDAPALEWVAAALARDPKHGPSHYLEGFLLRKRGDVEGAIASWRKAREEMPQSFEARHSLGELLAQQGRFAEAVPFLEEAYALASAAQGGDPSAQQALAQLRITIEDVRAKAKP